MNREQISGDELPPLSNPERIEFLKRLIFDFSRQQKEKGISNEEAKTIEGMLTRWKEELKTLEQE